MAREVSSVGVVGLGAMGAGIAQVCSTAGLTVVGREVSSELCERARAAIGRRLERAVTSGALTPGERDDALARLTLTTDLDALRDCDLVIEAAPEDLELKRALFADLDAAAPEAILATNTSALSVTELARATERPERVLGLHFFNPPPALPLVEVVRTPLTADEAYEDAVAFVERIGKAPVRCEDTPGFVVNRILVPMLNDAVRALDEGVATVEDIDRAMRAGANWPIGPLALIDLIGVDVLVQAAEALWQAFREPRFAPPPRLVRMMRAGQLGRKTGEGFYRYE